MCGIAGILTANADVRSRLEQTAERMIGPISHRGPDDSGVWVDPDVGVGFGFRRLAIIDLSERGHQPMHSASGRFTIIFNGEVYNFAPLRAELEGLGHRFRGGSDTEVILAAFEQWGIANAARRFVGMFAIAVWDARNRSLSLLRDRLGIKPLFYYRGHGSIAFGSELKALTVLPGFDRSIDRVALQQYFRYLYVPAPRTIYTSCRKLMPGHVLTITDPTVEPVSEPFWDLASVVAAAQRDPFDGSDAEAIDELERQLTDAVGLRMIADVPLGALLSGGVDSSTLVALMQKQSSRPIKTFTIGFGDADYDEAPHAARVARHIGTDHTTLPVTAKDALDVVPKLAWMFDEPLADSSQIPTFLVCELARRDVTVALAGDGGDELFAGYNRYLHGQRMVGLALRLPAPARRLLGAGVGRVTTETWDTVYRTAMLPFGRSSRHRLAGDKISKLGELLEQRSPAHMYRSLLSAWQEPASLVAGSDGLTGTDTALEATLESSSPPSLLGRMMLADQREYLPDDLLAKLDRVSMAVSLEARVPLLDHRVVELAWRFPEHLKVRDGVSKWCLRQVLYRHVPRELVERPKMGFSVPIDAWLRGPLRGWAEEMLSEQRLSAGGLLHAAPIRRAWTNLLGGRTRASAGIWGVLMFQAWRERWAA